MTERRSFNRGWPLVLAAGIVILDQISKWIIVNSIPLNAVGWQFWGDFFRIIHVRNLGVVFSLGDTLPGIFRRILFIILPLVVLTILLVHYIRDRKISRLQGWAIAGIIGGGLGNIIDRIFRPYGVVDFLDIKLYGIFGIERFPTFNIADSSVVICGCLLIISFFSEERRRGS